MECTETEASGSDGSPKVKGPSSPGSRTSRDPGPGRPTHPRLERARRGAPAFSLGKRNGTLVASRRG
jgi:hypothetical protein